jgi:outer membrane protein OmpA-like peptidoglycan-associated protein
MTTFSRLFLVSFSLAASAVGPNVAARAEGVPQLPVVKGQSGAEPALRVAQKADDDDKKFRKGARKDDGGGKGKGKDGGGPPQQKPDANAAAARQNAIQAKQEAVKARQEALKARQDAQKAKQDAVRANAFKGKQDAEIKRQQAIKERQNAVKAGQDARKAKLDAEAKRLQAIKERQDAAKAGLDAKRARDDAARANAVKAKQDAEAQRLQAVKDKQNAAQDALNAKRARDDAARANAAKAKQDAEKRGAGGPFQNLRERQDAAKAAAAARGDSRKMPFAARREVDIERAKALKVRQAQERRAKGISAKYDRSKADRDFERARERAQAKGKGGGRDERWTPNAANRFENLRRERRTRDVGSRNIIIEPDKRIIVRNDYGSFIRHDESARIARKRKEIRRERRKDGLIAVVTAGLAGALIYSLQDEDGRVIRRSRRDQDGREYVFFDDTHAYHDDYRYGDDSYRDSYIDLPPPVIRIPHDRYVVDYDRASPDDIYDALNAPPVEELDRGYTLDEVRQNYRILERMRRVDLDAINFEFASWDVPPEQYSKLERLARAMQRVIDRSPGEVFLIEGHTDAVGDDVDNLSLSDRRAEAVAVILTDTFGIPPENLVTQGYGEEYLKEQTDEPSWINRRVSVRRVTPLLERDGSDEDAYSSR